MNATEQILERKRTEGSRPVLTAERVELIRQWFRDHPDQRHCYLFYDDSLEGEDGGLKTVPGSPVQRMEQLVSMVIRGIPAMIGRGHSQIEEVPGVPFA